METFGFFVNFYRQESDTIGMFIIITGVESLAVIPDLFKGKADHVMTVHASG